MKRRGFAIVLCLLVLLGGLFSGCTNPSKIKTYSFNDHSLVVNIEGKGKAVAKADGPGVTATLFATPNSMWVFDHWEGDIAEISDETAIVMDGDKTVTACFSEITKIAVTQLFTMSWDEGSLSWYLMINMVGDGAVARVSSSGSALSSAEMTFVIRAEPARNWRFDHWSGEDWKGSVLSNDPEITITAYLTKPRAKTYIKTINVHFVKD